MLIVLLSLVALAAAAPQKPADQAVAIVKQDFDQQVDGSYRYRYLYYNLKMLEYVFKNYPVQRYINDS